MEEKEWAEFVREQTRTLTKIRKGVWITIGPTVALLFPLSHTGMWVAGRWVDPGGFGVLFLMGLGLLVVTVSFPSLKLPSTLLTLPRPSYQATPRKLTYSDYVKEGEKCEASEDFEGAIEYYTKAMEIRPDYKLHYKRACTYQKMKEMEKAAGDFKVFLMADERRTELDTTWWKFLIKGARATMILWQRDKAQSCLTQQTFKKILSTYDFDAYRYSNKKLYDWGRAMIGGTPEEARRMPKEKPQEAAYRMGVKRLLQGELKKAIQRLDEAIEMNPEDARSYLFRGIAHHLQSRKGGRFGPSRARELSKTKAGSDIERAVALSKGNALIERACIRMRDRIFLWNKYKTR